MRQLWRIYESNDIRDACKVHEVFEVVLVRTPGLRIGDVRKPFDLRWHIGQVEKFLRGKCAGFGGDERARCFFLVGHSVVQVRCQ